MGSRYSIAEAKDRLPALVHEAESDGPVEITRRGRPVAVLVSIDAWDRVSKQRADFWARLMEFRERTDLDDLDVDGIFGDVRDRTPGRDPSW